MEKNILDFSQLAISILLIIFIVLQQRGTALGSAFGGGGEVYSTRRGFQKYLLIGTVILAIAFIVLSILSLSI